MINSLVEANSVLALYIPLTKEITGKDITLERMRPLMDSLGNPERKLKIIHIAGTSGKTSTAYYIASLLKQQGQTVGLTVSPHMDSVTERVQINLQPLTESEFCKALDEFINLLDKAPLQPTYFELLTAFAYWYFAKVGVDYAVVETGLGGLFDATNIAQIKNKVCVITDIGYDHMHVLGNTLTEIATQKAGVIWQNNPVFTYLQSTEIMSVIKAKCSSTNSILNVLSINEHPDEPEGLEGLPLYQKRNWILAKYVYDFVAGRDGLQKLSSAQISSSMKIQVPGRMEIVKYKGKTLIMDGAHNKQKMTSFIGSFKAKFPYKKVAVLLSLKRGKDYKSVLPLLLPICATLVLTSFNIEQDIHLVSASLDEVATEAQLVGFKSVHTEPDSSKALEYITSLPGDIVIVTGSLYLLSVLRPEILGIDD